MSAEEERALSARWRARIEAVIAELTAASAATKDDRAPVTLDQQSVGRLALRDATHAQAMAAATQRRGSEFGWREDCGGRIAEGRLEIDAAASRCVSRARGGDQRRGG